MVSKRWSAPLPTDHDAGLFGFVGRQIARHRTLAGFCPVTHQVSRGAPSISCRSFVLLQDTQPDVSDRACPNLQITELAHDPDRARNPDWRTVLECMKRVAVVTGVSQHLKPHRG